MTQNITPLHPSQGPALRRQIAIRSALRNARFVLVQPDNFTAQVQQDAHNVLAHFGTPSERDLMGLEHSEQTGQAITYLYPQQVMHAGCAS